MKKIACISTIAIAVMGLFLSCSQDNGIEAGNVPGSSNNQQSSGGGEGTVTGLTDFTIAFDATPLVNENEPTCEEKYQYQSLGTVPQVNISYTTGGVTVNGVTAPLNSEIDTEGGKVTVSDGNTVFVSCSKSANYILTSNGKEVNGSFAMKKNTMGNIVTLNNVKLTYESIQGKGIAAAKSGTVFIDVKDGTENSITSYKKAISCGQDPTEEGNEDFTGGDVVVSGSGTLNIKSASAGALYSEGGMVYLHKGTVLGVTPAAGKHGISGYTGVVIAGGVQNIQLSGDAPKGVKSSGTLSFIGGRTTVINNGSAVWDETENDYSSASCVKAPDVTVDGATLLCYATGNGGKGIRADNTMTVKSGTIKVITEGQNIVRSSNSDKVCTSVESMGNSTVTDANPKGIHVGDKDATPATGTQTINGGDVKVKVKYSEGIESKMAMTVNGGTVQAYASDDAINVGISSESNRGNNYAGKGTIIINGGNVLAYSTTNDGIDANGTITINGGTALAFGATGAECGIDCDNSSFLINGGSVIGLGGSNISTPSTSSKQPVLITSCSIQKGTTYTLGGLTFTAPVAYNSATAVLSDGSFTVGGTVTFAGTTVTLTSQVTGQSNGMGGGMTPGGMRPGWR